MHSSDEYRYSTRSQKTQRMLRQILKWYLDNNTCDSSLWWDRAAEEEQKLHLLLKKRDK